MNTTQKYWNSFDCHFRRWHRMAPPRLFLLLFLKPNERYCVAIFCWYGLLQIVGVIDDKLSKFGTSTHFIYKLKYDLSVCTISYVFVCLVFIAISTAWIWCDHSHNGNFSCYGESLNLLLPGEIGNRKLCKNGWLRLQYGMVRAANRIAKVFHFDDTQFPETALLLWI